MMRKVLDNDVLIKPLLVLHNSDFLNYRDFLRFTLLTLQADKAHKTSQHAASICLSFRSFICPSVHLLEEVAQIETMGPWEDYNVHQ